MRYVWQVAGVVVGDRLLSRDHYNRTKFAARKAASGIIRRSEAVVVGVRSTAQSSGAAGEGREGYPGRREAEMK